MEKAGATKAGRKATQHMGFSHAWRIAGTIPFQPWNAIVNDAKRLAEAYPLIEREHRHWLCLSAMHKDKPPQIDVVGIRLNGAPTPLEDFVFTPKEVRLQYCKTLYLPHDTIVVAILAVARDHTDLITVWSDGDLEHWQPPLTWASQVLGRELAYPVEPR
jgi:hypothetical protein